VEKLDSGSLDIVSHNIERLKEIFPDVFSEGKVDFEALESVLGEYIDRDNERYSFTWKGKSHARRIAQTPSTGTLRPASEESKNWESTENLYIEGDNLEVLKLLQKSYHKQVKMIYIDPPYNTGKDFVYKDNFKDNIKNYLKLTSQVDSDGKRLSTNSETNGRYHSDWLNMMYPRLKLARNLLKDDGVIFISIDDNEVSNLRKLCDEIFGEDNFYVAFMWQRRSGSMDSTDGTSTDHEYVLCYGKQSNRLRGVKRRYEKYKNPDNDPRGPWISDNLSAGKAGGDVHYEITDPNTGNTFLPPKGRYWPYSPATMKQKILENRILFPKVKTGRPMLKRFQNEAKSDYVPVSSILRNYTEKNLPNNALIAALNTRGTSEVQSLFNDKIFSFPKSIILLKSLMSQVIDKDSNDIILDFFSGSATTADAIINQNMLDGGNRKFIMVQLPEETDEKSEAYKAGYKNICEIGKERIRRAGEKIKEENVDKEGIENLDIGFKVFKLDSSNIKAWDPESGNLEQNLWDSVENIKSDRSPEDLMYEILLKYGLDLTLPIEELELVGKKVYVVGLGSLVICLDEAITLDTIEEIATLKEKYESDDLMRVVFRDNGFKDAEVKTNAIQILKQFGIDDVKSL